MKNISNTPQKRRLLVCNGTPIGKKVLSGIVEEENRAHKVSDEFEEQAYEFVAPSTPVRVAEPLCNRDDLQIPEAFEEYPQSNMSSEIQEFIPDQSKIAKETEITKELIDQEIEKWNADEHSIKLKMLELSAAFDDLIENEKKCAVQIAQMTANLVISADPMIPVLLEECEKIMQENRISSSDLKAETPTPTQCEEMTMPAQKKIVEIDLATSISC